MSLIECLTETRDDLESRLSVINSIIERFNHVNQEDTNEKWKETNIGSKENDESTWADSRKLVSCEGCQRLCGSSQQSRDKKDWNEEAKDQEAIQESVDDIEKTYSYKIMEALHEILDIGMDESKDQIRKLYSTGEILNAVLTYEGLIGYADIFIRFVKDIYGVDLDDIED